MTASHFNFAAKRTRLDTRKKTKYFSSFMLSSSSTTSSSFVVSFFLLFIYRSILLKVRNIENRRSRSCCLYLEVVNFSSYFFFCKNIIAHTLRGKIVPSAVLMIESNRVFPTECQMSRFLVFQFSMRSHENAQQEREWEREKNVSADVCKQKRLRLNDFSASNVRVLLPWLRRARTINFSAYRTNFNERLKIHKKNCFRAVNIVVSAKIQFRSSQNEKNASVRVACDPLVHIFWLN